ncbi:MAG: diacylglycerol kinase family protein [Solobacterium sp.]|nr:diacylglycerol kinase family protein [Solobacterium sp.]
MKDKFENAFRGLMDGLCDHSIRTQFILAFCALTAGFVLKLNLTEWLVVIVCMGLVICSEMLNTCIEQVCDLYDANENEKIRRIKDLGAGAVLMASLTALVCALLILLHHIG